MRGAALALAVLAAVAIAGCGSPTQTSTATVQVKTDAPTPSPTPEPNSVGEQVSNGGITLTVKAASTASTIELNESGFPARVGLQKSPRPPQGTGAKFGRRETPVGQNAKKSLDLTCSVPVSTKLVDKRSGSSTRLTTSTRSRAIRSATTSCSRGSSPT